MMLFLINRADDFHSLNSFRQVGIADSLDKAIVLIEEEAKEDGFKLSNYDLKNLREIKQTQSSDFEGEFNINEIELNKRI